MYDVSAKAEKAHPNSGIYRDFALALALALAPNLAIALALAR
jgi:hypothetical protein